MRKTMVSFLVENHVMAYPGKRSPEFSESVVKLIGHAIGGAALFLSLAVLSWFVGVVVAAMDKVHPFSAPVLQILHGVEIGLLYLDVALSSIVLLVGAFRFVKEITGVKHDENHFY
jgi:hypothetical protein